MKHYHTLALRELFAQKMTSFLILIAIVLSTMMTALRATDFGSDIQVNVRAVFDGQLAALARLLRPYFEADAQRVGQQASTAKGVV